MERGRGELRIYLGAAPGVGKTYAVLGEARRRRERGTDVVVGLVETHGRAKTAELLDGLETVPRRPTGELDLDALLDRDPQVAVIDELAHANAPGSRNPKRWQDVEELLAAGIDVLSTVNVQELESLNDVVRRITGLPQRETIPDAVVRRAEQVELVDITPEALRRRLAHGNIYPAEAIDAAVANQFRVGTLTALRELALLWVADQVDVALQRHRSDQAITDTWEARERVVVAVTGGPESETLIRRARRVARRAGADLLAVHVLRGADPDHVARLRALTEDLGATFHTVVGDDVPRALLDFARGVNATQLVLGTSRRSRLARVVDEGIGAATIQASGPIDVHMVTHEEAGDRRPDVRRRPFAWAMCALLPAAATAVGLVAEYATVVVGYFLATVVVALLGGLRPAVVSAFLGAGLLNFFFTEPRHSLVVHSAASVITLVAMLATGVLVALVVDRAARMAEQGGRARTEAALLASYSRTVLTHPDPLPRLLAKVRGNFAQDSATLLERRDGHWDVVAHDGGEATGEPDVTVPVTDDVVLALRGRPLPAADQRVLEAAAGQALLALRQQRMAAETASAQRRAETTELRTAILSAVGHDLRTPLTSIKAAVASLRDPDLTLSPSDTDELLETAELSVDRLSALVDNLLDSSRLATGAVTPRLSPTTLDEAVARALAGIDDRTAVTVDVPEQLPPVLADLGLLERVIANVVDNALRHGTPPVAIRASTHGPSAELRVVDHGPGVPKNAATTVFAPFQRLGDRAPGIGLGLSVAKGFTEAMGGTITAEDTPGGGLTIAISLPLA